MSGAVTFSSKKAFPVLGVLAGAGAGLVVLASDRGVQAQAAHVVAVAAWWAPRLVIGLCMSLMLGYAAVGAVAEHRRRAAAVHDRAAAASHAGTAPSREASTGAGRGQGRAQRPSWRP